MNTLASNGTDAYAAQVRAALGDLSSEEVEELTGGLEADLAESWADNGGMPLVDPVAYAAELRHAAGLPFGQRRPGFWAKSASKWRQRWTSWVGSFRDMPGGTAVADYLVALRPAWWFLRAWLAYQVLFAYTILGRPEIIPGNPFLLLVLLVFVVGSVWLGMRKLTGFFKGLVILGNAIAVIVLLVVSSSVAGVGANNYGSDPGWDDFDHTGVYLNGEEVTNIFAYDAQGNPIEQIQLFDQNGKVLTTSVEGGNGCLTWVADPSSYNPDDEYCDKSGVWVPTLLETGAKAWNVFPMSMVESSDDFPETPLEGAEPVKAGLPFVKVPALEGATEPVKAEKKGKKKSAKEQD